MTSSSAAVNARSNSSRVLVFAARINVLMFDYISSIGEKSSEYGASQMTRAPHSSATSSMRLAWWALRLSSTSTSPRLVVLQKIFWPQLVVLSGTSRAQHIVRSVIFCNTTGALDLEDHAVEADAPDSLQPAPECLIAIRAAL